MKLVLTSKYLYFGFIASFIGCFPIKPPPITFTQSQTAAEKQIVGEVRELEDNGWLIASSQTSSSGSGEWERKSFLSGYGRLYEESARLLIYLGEDVIKYRKKGILGESYSGELKFVPMSMNKLSLLSETEQKRLKEIVQIVNQHRLILLEERLKIEKSSGKTSLGKLEENLKLMYLHGDDKGNYQEIEPGKWVIKQIK